MITSITAVVNYYYIVSLLQLNFNIVKKATINLTVKGHSTYKKPDGLTVGL